MAKYSKGSSPKLKLIAKLKHNYLPLTLRKLLCTSLKHLEIFLGLTSFLSRSRQRITMCIFIWLRQYEVTERSLITSPSNNRARWRRLKDWWARCSEGGEDSQRGKMDWQSVKSSSSHTDSMASDLHSVTVPSGGDKRVLASA
jgi:hypothetical protein